MTHEPSDSCLSPMAEIWGCEPDQSAHSGSWDHPTSQPVPTDRQPEVPQDVSTSLPLLLLFSATGNPRPGLPTDHSL